MFFHCCNSWVQRCFFILKTTNASSDSPCQSIRNASTASDTFPLICVPRCRRSVHHWWFHRIHGRRSLSQTLWASVRCGTCNSWRRNHWKTIMRLPRPVRPRRSAMNTQLYITMIVHFSRKCESCEAQTNDAMSSQRLKDCNLRRSHDLPVWNLAAVVYKGGPSKYTSWRDNIISLVMVGFLLYFR